MNRLCGSRCYLIGPMDRVADGGVTWREDLQKYLEQLGVVVFNPCNKPISLGREDAENRELRKKLKDSGDFDTVRDLVKMIRVVDLRMVDITDFSIVHLDVDVHMCGSYEEIALANRQKKPVLVHVKQGKENTPDWLLGQVPHELIFSSWSELKDYILHVHAAENFEHYKRWMFFDVGIPTLQALLKAAEHNDKMRKIVLDWSNEIE